MPFHVAKADETFVRAGRRWVYGFLAGPETTGWNHIAYRWVMKNLAWRPAHKDGGVTACHTMYVQEAAAPGSLDTTMDFVAHWQADAPETPYGDYEVQAWYDHSSGSPVLIATTTSRTITRATEPAQQHALSFDVRRQADTSDPDSGFHTVAGNVVNSGVHYYTDPRDPV